MNDFLDTIVPVVVRFGGKVKRFTIKNFTSNFERAENGISIHPITRYCQDLITNTLSSDNNIEQMLDYIKKTLERLNRCVKRFVDKSIDSREGIDEESLQNLKNQLMEILFCENNGFNQELLEKFLSTKQGVEGKLLKEIINKISVYQESLFQQCIIFMNHFFVELKSKYIFNTLTNNNLKDFKNKAIGDKIKNLIGNESETSGSGCCCVHYAIFFKQIFDEFEKITNLGTSNFLFLEKTDGLNHAGLIVTFKGKNYIIDASHFNNKLIQPVAELGQYYDRMKLFLKYYIDNVPSLQDANDKYINNNDNYFKVAVKTSDDLISLLESSPLKIGKISRVSKIFNKKLGFTFSISKTGVSVLGIFNYYFDSNVIKNFDKIDRDSFLKLVDSITYKTKISDNKRIRVFDFEREYIKDMLYYFSDKIDYSVLRKVLSST